MSNSKVRLVDAWKRPWCNLTPQEQDWFIASFNANDGGEPTLGSVALEAGGGDPMDAKVNQFIDNAGIVELGIAEFSGRRALVLHTIDPKLPEADHPRYWPVIAPEWIVCVGFESRTMQEDE